jgi:hypothetical protein
MFGFDGNTKGFEKILTQIADNFDAGKHTHKKVRAYARCLLQMLPEINIDERVKPEVEILLAALSASGLPHYDRAKFLKILVLGHGWKQLFSVKSIRCKITLAPRASQK